MQADNVHIIETPIVTPLLNIIQVNKKNFQKDVGMKYMYQKASKQGVGIDTKLNVHSPIPTSFSHVTATALGHYYNCFVGPNVSTCHTRRTSDVITRTLVCMGMCYTITVYLDVGMNEDVRIYIACIHANVLLTTGGTGRCHECMTSIGFVITL